MGDDAGGLLVESPGVAPCGDDEPHIEQSAVVHAKQQELFRAHAAQSRNQAGVGASMPDQRLDDPKSSRPQLLR